MRPRLHYCRDENPGLRRLVRRVLGMHARMERAEDIAHDEGFASEIIVGSSFHHRVYLNRINKTCEILHVYIEHDGVPWFDRTHVSPDPMVHNPLMLRLMALDAVSAIYLGRPCYDGLATAPSCSSAYWTRARYSEAVVTSMQAALRKILDTHACSGLAFFGYSGGGALAVLLAQRFPETRAVVTVAGNLDIQAWTEYHGYSPLTDSLNPATQPPLSSQVIQKHYVGGRDRNVPAILVRGFAGAQVDAEVHEFAEFDHACCWRDVWPAILADLQTTLGESAHHGP